MTYCHEGRRTRAAKPGGVGRCEEKEEEEGGKVAIPPDFQEGKGERRGHCTGRRRQPRKAAALTKP